MVTLAVVVELIFALVFAAYCPVVFDFAIICCEFFCVAADDPKVVILPDHSMPLSFFGHFANH